MSSETVETLEYREQALGNEFPAEAKAEEPEPAALNLLEEIAVAFRQCCEAGEKVYVSVVNWASTKPECQRPVAPEADCGFVDKGGREIQLTVSGEREMSLTNTVQTDI